MAVQRNYKDTVFRMIFNGKKELLTLYNTEYVQTVRTYSLEMPIEQAVERAVDECIRRGILVGFLFQNRAEATAMSIYEYNEEAHLENVRKEGYEEGREEYQL